MQELRTTLGWLANVGKVRMERGETKFKFNDGSTGPSGALDTGDTEYTEYARVTSFRETHGLAFEITPARHWTKRTEQSP